MIRILVFDDEPAKCCETFVAVSTEIESTWLDQDVDDEPMTIEYSPSNKDHSQLLDDFKKAPEDCAVYFYIVDYRFFEDYEEVRQLVHSANITAFDICMKTMHQTNGQSPRMKECAGDDKCMCGYKEVCILRGYGTSFLVSSEYETPVLPPNRLALFSSNTEQRKKIDKDLGFYLRDVKGYVKGANQPLHIKRFAQRILQLVDEEARGLKPRDLALELAETWNMGGPSCTSHGFNSETIRPDGSDFAVNLKMETDTAAWKAAITDTVERFRYLTKWLADRKVTQLFHEEVGWFNERIGKIESVLSIFDSSVPQEKGKMIIWFNQQIGEIWSGRDSETARDIFFRMHLTTEGATGETSSGPALCKIIKDKLALTQSSENEIHVSFCEKGRGSQVFVPKPAFIELFNPLLEDLMNKQNDVKRVQIKSWQAKFEKTPADYFRVILALKWHYPDSDWRNCDHPFETVPLKPFYDEKWLKYLYDLWLISAKQSEITLLHANRLKNLEKDGLRPRDALAESISTFTNNALTFWELKIDNDKLGLGSGKDDYNHCLLFAISSCGKAH